MDVIDEIRRVIDIGNRSAAIRTRKPVPLDSKKPVNLIASCDGQVFVAGVGKSGIIGQKIAATLRSTGTPAVFLHATEALHGDVGVVRQEDVVLCYWKKAERAVNWNTLLRVLKKIKIPIIALTSNGESSLAELADVVLELPILREACPLNLAADFQHHCCPGRGRRYRSDFDENERGLRRRLLRATTREANWEGDCCCMLRM